MKAIIMGIGGVGGYFGGKLARFYAASTEHEIVFIARGEHLEEIKNNGIKITTKDEGSWIARPNLSTDNPAEAGSADVIFFAVKGYDLEKAAELVKPCLHDDTVSISLLNGIDNAERLSSVIRRGHVLNGCVYISAHRTAPGAITQVGGPCTIFFGPETGAVEPFRSIEKFLTDADIKATLSDNITSALWSKYLFVGPLGGITSLAAMTVGAVVENEEHRSMLEGMMKEVEAVARARKVTLPDDIVERSMAMASSFPYETKTSIQLDFEKGNRTELDTFIGFLVKTGKSIGIETPLHERVYRVLAEKKGG